MFIIIPTGSTQTKYTLTHNDLQNLVEPETDLLVGGNPNGFYLARSRFKPLYIPISNYKKDKGGILSYLDIQYNITPYIHKLFVKKGITYEQLIQYLKQNPEKTFSHFWYNLTTTFYQLVKFGMTIGIVFLILLMGFLSFSSPEHGLNGVIIFSIVAVAVYIIMVLPFWIVKKIFQISVNKQIEAILTF
jgi:hypothetical protein